MKDHRIAIFIPEGERGQVDACLASIQMLRVPEGYELKLVRWQNAQLSLAETVRQLVQESSAE